MKLMKNKAFVGILCLALAAAISFLLIPRFYSQQRATVYVPKAAKEITAGTTITAALLRQAEIGSYGLSDSVLRDADSIVGMVAAETIHDGETFWETALVSAEDYAVLKEEQSKGLSNGLCLVTIKFPSASAGVAGVLRSGSRVNAFSCMEDRENGTYETVKALESLYVYDVLNSDFESLDKVDEAAENAIEGDNTNYNYEPMYVVIRCTEGQAKTLISLERSGALHLTLQRTEG